LLIKLGLAHEEASLRHLTEVRNLEIARIRTDLSLKDAAAETVAAIRDGAQVIYQATFSSSNGKAGQSF
jgi:hypothetical protein